MFYFSKKVRLFPQNDVLFLFYFLINLTMTTVYKKLLDIPIYKLLIMRMDPKSVTCNITRKRLITSLLEIYWHVKKSYCCNAGAFLKIL